MSKGKHPLPSRMKSLGMGKEPQPARKKGTSKGKEPQPERSQRRDKGKKPLTKIPGRGEGQGKKRRPPQAKPTRETIPTTKQ